MISTSKILNYLSVDESIEQRKLEKALKITKKSDRLKLEIAINAFKKLQIVDSDHSGNLKLHSDSQSIKSTIRCSSKGYCFAVREDGLDDIYIREHHLNNAWHGDIVLVKLTKEAERRRAPEGVVQCIVTRNTKSLISIIKEEDSRIYASPLDDRILVNINLEEVDRKYIDNTEEENIVEVKIVSYPFAQYPAVGKVVRKLSLDKGYLGDLDILLTKSNLQDDIECPPAKLKDISDMERIDLTGQDSLLLCGWEHETAPGLPALFAEHCEFGTRIWLHSPAVAERFSIGGKIDLWLREKGEALCLGNQWRDLLSCSLNNKSKFIPNKISEAVTLSIDIDNKGTILNWEFCLSRIKPVDYVSSKQIESISNRKPRARTIPNILKPLKDHISQIQTILFISEELEKNTSLLVEMDLPAANIDRISEMKWENPGRNYSGWKKPLNRHDSNSILNSFIKVANTIWFYHAYNYKIDTIYTESNPIEKNTINDLIKSVLATNIELELDQNGNISLSDLIISIQSNDNKRIFYKILKQIIKDKSIKLSNPSEVIDFNSTESKLDYRYQSPWLCSLNNYVDIFNQHLLVLLLKEGKSKEKARSKVSVNLGLMNSWNDLNWPLFTDSIYKQISTVATSELLEIVKRNTHKINNFNSNIISMAKSREASLLLNHDLDACITGVQSYGFFADIPPLMFEGLVHVSTLNDDWYEYRSRQNMLIGRKNKKTYQLGDKVLLNISKIDLLRNQIDLVISKSNSIDNSIVENNQESTIKVDIT